MRIIRCLLVVLLALPGQPAGAQAASGAVRSAGSGPVTWVLVSGLVGGTAGFSSLEQELRKAGHRVITIDPYALSIDSADVSFAALARRADAVVDGLGARRVHLVGHSNGAGVALRMAANAPDRVEALYLLDAGALPTNAGKVLGRSLRLVPLIARVPGGRAFLRGRLFSGIRESSGSCEWFDDAAQRRYADPILGNVGRVVALAVRLGQVQEPDSIATVVARVRTPVTVILGDAPHPSAPAPAELRTLEPLGARLTVIHMPGVGHFPHEEATRLVTLYLLRGVIRTAGAGAGQ